MRTGIIIFCATFFFFFSHVACSHSADIAKIGVVNFQKLFKISSAGKKAMAELNKKGKGYEAELKKRAKEIEQIKEKLDREALVMSKEMRTEKERDFRIKLNDFRSLEKKYANELRSLDARLTKRIKEDLFELAEKIGKKEGYLLIIEKSGVVYFPNTIDITDKLVQQYNAVFATKADTESKTKKE